MGAKLFYWDMYMYKPDTCQGSSFSHYFSYFLLSVSWLHPFLKLHQLACNLSLSRRAVAVHKFAIVLNKHGVC